MKYKVGNRVKIKSLDWYNENKDEFGNIDINEDFTFYADRSRYCGRVFTIDVVFDNCYTVKEDNHEYYWADEMFEGLVEEDIIDIDKFQDDNKMIDIIDECVHRLKDNECQINLPEGYIFKDENGNVINATKIVLEKKKNEYPKNYEECLSVLQIKGYDIVTYVPSWTAYEKALYQEVLKLRELIICRDIYWKLYGDEMGLGKPWKPDYANTGEKKFSIWVDFGEIRLGGAFTTTQMVLSFPTAEMRDAFYENFKKLIEQCKELL